jgi:hypothetical protein
MNLFGLLDAKNVPVAVLHYSAPAVILLYFVFTSSIPAGHVNAVAENASASASASGSASTPAIRTRQLAPSNLLKWVFVLAILTFVCRH